MCSKNPLTTYCLIKHTALEITRGPGIIDKPLSRDIRPFDLLLHFSPNLTITSNLPSLYHSET